MQYDPQSSGATLSSAAVRLLCSRRTIEILDAIGNQARPVVEIAGALDDDLGRVWREVRKLEKAGILTVRSKRRRGGRPQKLYEASAQEFVVADSARHRTVSHELSRALMDSIERHASSSTAHGGELRKSIPRVLPPATSSTSSGWLRNSTPISATRLDQRCRCCSISMVPQTNPDRSGSSFDLPVQSISASERPVGEPGASKTGQVLCPPTIHRPYEKGPRSLRSPLF